MEDAQQRKQRLRGIRDAAAANGSDNSQVATAGPAAKELKFRNYQVKDQKIEHKVIEAAQAPKLEAPKPQIQTKRRPEDLLANVAPKKQNWDLRRDVEKQLAKLERRTQRALVQLYQEQQAQEA